MIRRMFAVIGVVMVANIGFAAISPTHAASGPACGADVNLGVAAVSCRWSAQDLAAKQLEGETLDVLYRLERDCRSVDAQGVCFGPVGCEDTPGTAAHKVVSKPREGGTWVQVAYICLPPGSEPGDPGPDDIARRFKELDWPAATLMIQPPEGETLVNFDTIFYTTTTESTTKNVSVLGVEVQVRATPTSYTWHWNQEKNATVDADVQPFTTDDAGAAYPNQTITWQYTDAYETVRPSVDVTYSGEYRIPGIIDWTPIEPTRTITGTPSALDVLEARPTLVN